MITRTVLLLWTLCAALHAATTDLIYSISGGDFQGTPGNVVFNGEHFVTGVVLSNGTLRLLSFNTNGVGVSSNSPSLTGSTPRLALAGSDFLFTWLETNTAPSLLKAARVSNGTVAAPSILATNVAEDTVALSGRESSFVVVWRSAGSNSAIYARTVNADGLPGSDTFTVSPSSQPQRYPAIDTDGTNHLVCWMEQSVASNDWRVLAHLLVNGVPSGDVLPVSQTNSFAPHETACSFGTNYLVAWSANEGPHSRNDFSSYVPADSTNTWFAHVHGRMVTPGGLVAGNPFPIIRSASTNAGVTAVFNGSRYLVFANWISWLGGRHPGIHVLSADGSRAQSGIAESFLHAGRARSISLPRLAFAAGRICLLSEEQSEHGKLTMFGQKYMIDTVLTRFRRTASGTLALNFTGNSCDTLEYSTNLVHWTQVSWEYMTMTNLPRLFLRAFDAKNPCIENLRALYWAKQQWSLDYKRAGYGVEPQVSDLIGPGPYLPEPFRCPGGGIFYQVQALDNKPNCTIANHTF